MNIRSSILSLVFWVCLVFSPSLAFAQTASPSPSGSNQSEKLANLHTQCDTAITQRLTSLNSGLTRISGLTKLNADDKAKFTAQINTNIFNLNTQKTKCDSDTDLNTLRTDYKNVFLNFRIYAVFLPQTNLLVASDTMGVAADNLQTLYTKLQTRVQQAGNPSNLVNLLADMQAKIKDAKTQYATVESLVTPLTPSSFNTDPSGTKTTLTTARNDIKTGAGDLKAAYQDAVQIRAGLKEVNPPPSPSATTH